MPLVQSPSAEALEENVRRLVAEGYSREQAYAIAKDIQRRARARARKDNALAKRTAVLASSMRVLRSRRQRRRVRRLPRQVIPKGIEREYARALLRIVAETREALTPLFEVLPGLLASAARDREPERMDEGEGAQVRAMIEAIREQLRRSFDPAPTIEQIANRVSTHNREQLMRQVRAALGVDVFMSEAGVLRAIEAFYAEQLPLVWDVPRQFLSEVERASTRAIANGTLHRDLAKELEERLMVTRNRARLIARDQVGKLYGQVNASRQKALGVTSFVWRTVGDERVRDEHESREGVAYTYASPPGGELPGQAVQCRCYAEPVLTEIIEAM